MTTRGRASLNVPSEPQNMIETNNTVFIDKIGNLEGTIQELKGEVCELKNTIQELVTSINTFTTTISTKKRSAPNATISTVDGSKSISDQMWLKNKINFDDVVFKSYLDGSTATELYNGPGFRSDLPQDLNDILSKDLNKFRPKFGIWVWKNKMDGDAKKHIKDVRMREESANVSNTTTIEPPAVASTMPTIKTPVRAKIAKPKPPAETAPVELPKPKAKPKPKPQEVPVPPPLQTREVLCAPKSRIPDEGELENDDDDDDNDDFGDDGEDAIYDDSTEM